MKSCIKHLTLVIAASTAALTGCASDAPSNSSGTFEVMRHGTLRAMFHDNDLKTKVLLNALLPDSALYAVGALSDLRGEITVAGGVAYLSYPISPDSAQVRTGMVFDEGAALLVSARITEWQDRRTPRDLPPADLASWLEATAAGMGWDGYEAFPFLIDGDLAQAEWHTVDGSRLKSDGGGHAAHQQASVRARAGHVTARMVGFLSNHDQGVFTHMDSNTHVHVIVESPTASGHLDGGTVLAGAVVRFPPFQRSSTSRQ